MQPDKNLHASVSPALLTQAQEAAQQEHISLDELVQDAMERHLRQRRRQKLYAYGEQQARKLGIKESDVDRTIHDYRDEERERQNKERGR